MSESKMTVKPCHDCPCRCKPVLAILLIVLGLLMLGGEILPKRDQK